MYRFRDTVTYSPKLRGHVTLSKCNSRVITTGHDQSAYQIWSAYSFTRSKHMNENPKFKNKGDSWWLKSQWLGSAMPPFDTAHTTFCSSFIETACLCYFRYIASYLWKIAWFSYHACSGASFGMNLLEFRQDLWHQKTRIPIRYRAALLAWWQV